MRSEGMAFGVSQDISSAFGKGLNGLKVEAAMAKGGGLSVLDSVLLGAATIILAAIPVILARFPAPESFIIALELLQEWCTPSVCFVVLIVGVLIATSGVWGSLTSPEQNHKTFTEAYLSPSGPVSARQMDPLHMPDIFFSAETARANALSQSPVRVSAQPSSVIVPVYYPALIPSKDVDHPEAYNFNSDRSEWFGGAPDRFKESFSPQRFLDDSLLKDEDRARFMNLQAEERYVTQVEERYVPQSEERYVPLVEERYVPQVQDMYSEQEERYAVQVQESYPQEEEGYEPHEQDLDEERYGSNYDAPHVESITIGHDAEDRGYRSESEDEEYRYEPTVEDNQAQEREYVQSEAEPRQVELLSDTEEYHAHESYEEEDDEQLLPEPKSPPRAPDSPPATTAVEKAPSHKPPTPVTVEKAPLAKPPTPVAVEKALPPKPPAVPVEKALPPKPPAVPVEKAPPAGESPKVTLSPRTPPRHTSSRRPLSSSSSRSYAEFVRRTSTFSSKIPPSSVTTQSIKPEKTTSSSSGSSVMSKLVLMPARKPREVMVVDDDKLEVQDEASPDADELDQRVEAFLKNFRDQMRLQRQESLQRHRSRSLVDP